MTILNLQGCKCSKCNKNKSIFLNNNLSSYIIQDANIINQQFQSSEQLQELQNSIENFTNFHFYNSSGLYYGYPRYIRYS